MNRRRALIAAQSGGSVKTPIYTLENQTVTAGQTIATGCRIMGSGVASTILLDYTNTAAPTASGGASSKTKPIFISGNISADGTGYILAIGKLNRGDAYFRGWFYKASSASGTTMEYSQSAASRKRMAIRHSADGNSVSYWEKVGSGDIHKKTLSGTFYADANAQLKLGGGTSETGMQAGTIALCEVYDSVLSDDDLNAFFA